MRDALEPSAEEPLTHTHTGVWIAAGMMGVIALVLGFFFWQRRLLGAPGAEFAPLPR